MLCPKIAVSRVEDEAGRNICGVRVNAGKNDLLVMRVERCGVQTIGLRGTTESGEDEASSIRKKLGRGKSAIVRWNDHIDVPPSGRHAPNAGGSAHENVALPIPTAAEELRRVGQGLRRPAGDAHLLQLAAGGECDGFRVR